MTDLVVKERNGFPSNALPCVLFLLCVQSQLYENLLELLIHVVDAELLKAVVIKNFKAVDIKNAYRQQRENVNRSD